MMNNDGTLGGHGIAIIGMAGCFPGARNIEQFWHNLRDGREAITFFTEREVRDSGVDESILSDLNYVKAHAGLEDSDLFDASFFGYSAKEAIIMDPQHRIFLELAWHALEDAGYTSDAYEERIGVYAGASMNSYLFNIHTNQDLIRSTNAHQLLIGNDKDHLTTRVSYKLNLRGPSINIQTACSTSLVAIHLACQSLLNGECDMALAGGISIRSSRKIGYLYQEGGINSPDGHCRAFDAEAHGTIRGDGGGIVVLKRLREALDEGDHIYAIIRGSAINNDGSLKAGYTAPSIAGQAEVIADALAMAGIDPTMVTYIEAHGTGTPLGDPIELEALSQIYRAATSKRGFCAIGSVKTNIGHLDTAAGVAGLIKTVMSLKHRLLPPSLHFKNPNPKIDFTNSPFYVNTSLANWSVEEEPRIAGVSSFGMGGTNAHVIVQEAPPSAPSGRSRFWHLLVLSAKTHRAMETMMANLGQYLNQHADLDLADVAYTYQVGRKMFNHRVVAVCSDPSDAVRVLETQDPLRMSTLVEEITERSVAFLFPGQGSQYVGMAQALYQDEPVFREQIDECAALLKSCLGLDIRDILYPEVDRLKEASQLLDQTVITQPALFAVEYSLSRLLMSWGIHPCAMIGHSLGEYVAACLAGVFTLKEALALVTVRGKVMQALPAGAMLSVSLSSEEITPYLGEELSLAAINGPSLCVVSGVTAAVDSLQDHLTRRGVICHRLHTSHAFHSKLMEPVLLRFTEEVKKIPLKSPTIPYLSNVTGTWVSAQEATNPTYWAEHLRQTVLFAKGLQELLNDRDSILLEVGPGHTLKALAELQTPTTPKKNIFASLPHAHDRQPEGAFLLRTLGELWLAGVHIDWSGFYAYEHRKRIPLPSYPFERQRYWAEHQQGGDSLLGAAGGSYISTWKETLPLEPSEEGKEYQWLVFLDSSRLGLRIVEQIRQRSQHVIVVKMGKVSSRTGDDEFTIDSYSYSAYASLFEELQKLGILPDKMMYLWNLFPDSPLLQENQQVEDQSELAFFSLLLLFQALVAQGYTHYVDVLIISSHMQVVSGEEDLTPEKASILAFPKILALEHSSIGCNTVDIVLPTPQSRQEDRLIRYLIAESLERATNRSIAYRGCHRWMKSLESVYLNTQQPKATALREQGVYLIMGDLGSVGRALMQYLTRIVQAKLLLLVEPTLMEGNDLKQPVMERMEILEGTNAEILMVDSTNEERMCSVIDQIEKRLGTLHGVIHLGYTSNTVSPTIRDVDFGEYSERLKTCVRELLILERILEGKKLDFALFFSSSRAEGEPVLQAALAEFLKAFVHRHNQNHSISWTHVGWDVQQSAMDADQAALPRTAQCIPVTSFDTLFSTDAPAQLVISVKNTSRANDERTTTDSHKKEEGSGIEGTQLAHSHLELQHPYTAPANEVEQSIAVLWQELLGVTQVSIDDNFFELGGHSLMAAQLISRLRDIFLVNVPLRSIFERPTVAGMAAAVEEAFLEKIEALSEEEVQNLLPDNPS